MIVETETKRKSFARGYMAASGTGQMTSLVLSASYPHTHPTKVLLILGSLFSVNNQLQRLLLQLRDSTGTLCKSTIVPQIPSLGGTGLHSTCWEVQIRVPPAQAWGKATRLSQKPMKGQ